MTSDAITDPQNYVVEHLDKTERERRLFSDTKFVCD